MKVVPYNILDDIKAEIDALKARNRRPKHVELTPSELAEVSAEAPHLCLFEVRFGKPSAIFDVPIKVIQK